MKKIAVPLIVGLFIFSAALAQEKHDERLNNLCFFAFLSIEADSILTYDWLDHGGREGNPFWRPIINKPGLVFTIDLGIYLGMTYASQGLVKSNKFLGYAIPITVMLIQGYMFYRHCRVRNWL